MEPIYSKTFRLHGTVVRLQSFARFDGDQVWLNESVNTLINLLTRAKGIDPQLDIEIDDFLQANRLPTRPCDTCGGL
jgi:hypothetical protein